MLLVRELFISSMRHVPITESSRHCYTQLCADVGATQERLLSGWFSKLYHEKLPRCWLRAGCSRILRTDVSTLADLCRQYHKPHRKSVRASVHIQLVGGIELNLNRLGVLTNSDPSARRRT